MRITQMRARGTGDHTALYFGYFIVKTLPMVVSGLTIYLGYKLFILGVTGQASLSIQSNTVSGQLINAAPGLFFAVGGIVALIFSIVKGVSIDVAGDTEEPGRQVLRL